jgi:hypothetical protein
MLPTTVIVFGGPHVPDRAHDFLRKYRFIDIACHGEGEQVAVQILENLSAREWRSVAGVSFLQPDNTIVINSKAGRVGELSSLPSPYLEGTFDALIAANPSQSWIALWETNRGCPFSCTFCDWGSAIQSKVYPFDMDRLYKEVEWFAKHNIEFVFCCDANFGILPRDVDVASYVADMKRKTGYPHALSVQNTKNATERAYKVQKILSDAGLNKGVAIALQSVDADTLKSIKRDNISTGSYQELQRRFTRDKIETYSDVILALPGETYSSFANGVSTIMDNGQHNRIQFNNLSILPNSEMGDPEYQARYGMLTVESRIINVHGAIHDVDDAVHETQDLVIATNTMPRDEWVKTRSFAWMAGLLHFDKILQIPLIVLHEICGLSYRELFEVFSEGDLSRWPVLSEVRSFFRDKAQDIQNGGPEYCEAEQWLGMWWPADEYILIKLCYEKKLDAFYDQAKDALAQYLNDKFLSVPADLLDEAIELNRSLIKVPFQTQDLHLKLSYNIWEFYQAVLTGVSVLLDKKTHRYHIDRTTLQWLSWGTWCREVVWYGHRRGAYLYGNNHVEQELAGHY